MNISLPQFIKCEGRIKTFSYYLPSIHHVFLRVFPKLRNKSRKRNNTEFRKHWPQQRTVTRNDSDAADLAVSNWCKKTLNFSFEHVKFITCSPSNLCP